MMTLARLNEPKTTEDGTEPMIGKAIVGSVNVIVGVFGATALFWAGLGYDRLPSGWPNYQVRCCVLVNFALHAPGAGAVSAANVRAAAAEAELRKAQANEAILEGSIQAWNADGVKALAVAETTVQRALATQAVTARRLAMISAPIQGDDMCARVKAFDGTFTGALRQ
jgi:hypothetical protein